MYIGSYLINNGNYKNSGFNISATPCNQVSYNGHYFVFISYR